MRPDFVPERASSSEVRTIARDLTSLLATEQAIYARMSGNTHSESRLLALNTMIAEAHTFAWYLRQSEEEQYNNTRTGT